MKDWGDFKKEGRLIEQIVKRNKHDIETDCLIDDFVKLYDDDEICRGSFKSAIWFLVEHCKEKDKNDS